MDNDIVINGVNATKEFYLFALHQGLKGLLAYPRAKERKTNNWHEEEGLEIDASSVEFEPLKATINFVVTSKKGSYDKAMNFLNELKKKPYNEFYFGPLERKFKLRVLEFNVVKSLHTMQFIDLIVMNDNAGETKPFTLPTFNSSPVDNYKIDDIPFRFFNCEILDDGLKDFSSRHFKQIEKINDLDKMKLCKTYARNFHIKVLMTATNIGEFWNGYDALLHQLKQKGIHKFYIPLHKREIDFIYKNMQVQEFLLRKRKVWMIAYLEMIPLR